MYLGTSAELTMPQLQEILSDILPEQRIPAVQILGITHDSRDIQPGYLFVAISGQHADGFDFIPEAASKGAVAAVGSRPPTSDLPLFYLQVSDVRTAYSQIAANMYQHPSKRLTVTGVTGTNGKTSTTELITGILRACDRVVLSIGTLGVRRNHSYLSTGFTTPEANVIHRLLSEAVQEGASHAVLETSSHALAQHRVDHVDFDIVVFTNFTQDHLDFHASMKEYLAAKLILFRRTTPENIAVINMDDPVHEIFVEATNGRYITYGLGPESDVHIIHKHLTLNQTEITIRYGDLEIPLQSPLIGMYNLYNILAAVSTALALELPVAAIREGIRDVERVPGRLELISSAAQGRVFIDYAHTPDAYAKVLGTLRDLVPEETRITTLFGCGGDRDRKKRALMAAEAEKYSDNVILTSDNPRTEQLDQIISDTLMGFTELNPVVIKERRAALYYALDHLTSGSLLLILGKGREEYEIIGTEKHFHSDVQIVEGYAP